MTNKRTALFLADILLDTPDVRMRAREAAVELRRLYVENEQITQYSQALNDRCVRDTQTIGVLLEALKEIVAAADGTGWNQLDAGFTKARAAIKTAEESA